MKNEFAVNPNNNSDYDLEEFVFSNALPFLERIFQEKFNKISLEDEFNDAFEQIECFRKSEKFEVSYISFTKLRTNLLYEKYIYEIYAYDRDWYVNDFVKIGEMDVSYIFGWVKETKKQLWEEAKKYIGKFNICEIQNIVSKSLNDFELVFIKAFKNYKNINSSKTYDFTIYTGELYGNIHTLYERGV